MHVGSSYIMLKEKKMQLWYDAVPTQLSGHIAKTCVVHELYI